MVDEPTAELTEDGSGGARRSGHRRLRLLMKVLALCLVLGVGYLAVTFAQVFVASRQNDAPAAGAIVVLGAAQYDGRPSPVLEARLEHALDLYERGLASTIVVTGGRQAGDRFTESTTGYNWLREHGVPDEAILKEVQGRNTWESLRAVERFLAPRQVEDVILVSDASHSKRLLGVSSEVGLAGHASPERTVERSMQGQLRSLLRETAAVSVGRIVGYGRLTRWMG